jgi:kynurenine formamidase
LANDISHAADGIIGRGVLLDLPRALGRSWLEPAEAFVPADLELAEARAGVRVEPGDLLLVRTGRWARHAAALACELLPDGEGLFAMAGPDASVLGWLQEREVALIGGEGLNEAFPPDRTPARPPFHVVGIPAMGLCLLNNCDFERLAAACAARRRWEFLLVIAPLNLPGALGSPVNPVAVF